MRLSIPPGLGKLRVLVHFLRNAPFSEKPSTEFITFSEGPGKAGAIREKARSLNISRWPCRLPEPLGKLRTRLVLKQVIFIATETFHCDYSHSWSLKGLEHLWLDGGILGKNLFLWNGQQHVILWVETERRGHPSYKTSSPWGCVCLS